MVDLAKIRKKSKKPAEPGQLPAVPPAPASPDPSPDPSHGSEAASREPEPVAVPEAASRDDVPGDHAPSGPSKLDRFKAEAGKRREREGARVEAGGESLLELLTFVIAGEHYAVDIERIVEIVTPRNVTRIPNADPTVVGILSLRGTIVTLVDVRRKLRHRQSAASTADTRIVVIDFNNEIVGFLVDRVLRVVKASPGEIEPHPVVHSTELDQAVRGVFRVAGALTILLDLDKLLGHTWN